jgi:hypothetical protein
VALGGGGPKSAHQLGFQKTMYPCELLCGPGTREELIGQLDLFEGDTLCDEVEYLDRVFAIRVQGDEIDDPRSPIDFEACREEEGCWYLIRADHPLDAWCHVRDHRLEKPDSRKEGHCSDCPVTELGRFDSRVETARGMETVRSPAEQAEAA